MKFTVLGIPVAKGRPKFARKGNFVTSHTPQDTVNYENLVRLSYQQSFDDLRVLQGEVSMKIDAFFPIPKSTSKKKHQLMAIGAIQLSLIHIQMCIRDRQTAVKLTPANAVETTLFNIMETNKETGEVVNVLKEITGQAPGQINFDGNISEPEVFVIGMEADKVIEKESLN